MKVMGESIQDIRDKFKSISYNFLAEDKLFLTVLLVTIAFISFGLGRLAERAVQQTPQNSAPASVIFTDIASENKEADSTEPATVTEQYVASKSGTKYHYPWCPGAKQMKEENKIFFTSRAEAEAAGYTPAANCKGL